MILGIAGALVVLAMSQAPTLSADRLDEMLKAQAGTLSSAAFIYEGTTRWVGPSDLVEDPKTFGDEFQGAYLYRSDGAALLDVYWKAREPTSSVAHQKKAVLGGQAETMRVFLDAKSKPDPEQDVQSGPGSIANLSSPVAPYELFQPWYWKETAPFRDRGYAFQGWETIGDSRCARFRIDSWTGGHKRGEDYQVYWVDLDRNGQIVRSEHYADGSLTVRVDDVQLREFPIAGGEKYWLPVRCRVQGFFWQKPYSEPLYEKTIAIVNGSVMLDTELPDALFSVRRASALPLPGELERIAKSADPHSLRKKFAQQVPPPPHRVDPISVRARIEKQLSDAERQADQLDASSPARTFWSGTRILQVIVGTLGLVAVAWAAIRWRRR